MHGYMSLSKRRFLLEALTSHRFPQQVIAKKKKKRHIPGVDRRIKFKEVLYCFPKKA